MEKGNKKENGEREYNRKRESGNKKGRERELYTRT